MKQNSLNTSMVLKLWYSFDGIDSKVTRKLYIIRDLTTSKVLFNKRYDKNCCGEGLQLLEVSIWQFFNYSKDWPSPFTQ